MGEVAVGTDCPRCCLSVQEPLEDEAGVTCLGTGPEGVYPGSICLEEAMGVGQGF